MERQRLGSQHPPHLVVGSGGQQIVFQNGAWPQQHPDLTIYDDAFVASNVCSGIDLGAAHRQNLHELTRRFRDFNHSPSPGREQKCIRTNPAAFGLIRL